MNHASAGRMALQRGETKALISQESVARPQQSYRACAFESRALAILDPTPPTVACVMLTRDRPEMALRAVRCFERQTYPNRILIVIETGGDRECISLRDLWRGGAVWIYGCSPASIGAMRNAAAYVAQRHFGSEIIAHWDDDDLVAPEPPGRASRPTAIERRRCGRLRRYAVLEAARP